VVPDRDFFSCPEEDIVHTTSELTMVGGKIVYAAGRFSDLDETTPPPAMPDWSPVNRYGGYAAWKDPQAEDNQTTLRSIATASCGCGSSCGIHGHDHARSWAGTVPASDLRAFWGVLGCS